MTRREVFRTLAVLVPGICLQSSGRSELVEKPTERPAIQFGAQTNAWAIDPKRFDTLLAVLTQIRQIGYSGFETGFGNLMNQFRSPRTTRRQIENTGLTFFGVHVYLPRWLYDPSTNIPPPALYEKIVPGSLALGAQHVIFSAAPVADTGEPERKIAGLNAAGKYCKQIGLTLAYHNETAQESQPELGELEALCRQTDPKYVSFLLDCGHAYQGGTDVPAFLQKHHARIIGLHLRDYKNAVQVPLGQGNFPLERTAAVLKYLHWKGWVLNEEERLDGAKHGSEYMRPAFRAMEGAFSA